MSYGTLLALAGVFIAVAALILGAYRFVLRRRLAMGDAARSRLLSADAAPSQAALVRAEEVASDLPLLNRLMADNEWTPKLALTLRQAGLTMTPGTFVLIVAVAAALGLIIGHLLGPLGLVAGGACGVGLPIVWLRMKRKHRIGKFDEQLPGAIDMLVSALKTGYSFHAATKFLGLELPPLLGPEFARVYEEQRLGIDPATALLGMQERIGSVEIKMFVTAVLIQRKTGGNLSEVLTNTADLTRERLTIRGQLETLTAEGKWSGRILALLPVFVFFVLSYIAPQFMGILTETSIGRTLLAGSAVSVIIGYIVMMKIANVDY
jgi:tight adherence protein B